MENTAINMMVEERLVDILSDLISGEDDISDAIDILEDFIKKYNLDFKSLDTALIVKHFEELLSDYIYQEIDDLEEYITSEDEADDKKEEILNYFVRIDELGLTINRSMLNEFNDVKWYEIAINNELKRLMEKDD